MNKTKGICPKCKKIVPAETIIINNKVYLKKFCSIHGSSTHIHEWEDPEIYNFFIKHGSYLKKLCPDTLLVNITNKCNLNCSFCYVGANEIKQPEFNLNNIDKLKDFKKIYLTGGEPTIRDDIFKIIKLLKKKKHKVAILTNGIKLADKNFALNMKKAGIDMVLLQLDSLNQEYNRAIRGYDDIPLKKKVIKNLQELKIPIYPISIVLEEQKEKEIKNLLNFLFDKYHTLGIQFTPVITTGRINNSNPLTSCQIMNKLIACTGASKQDFIDSTRFLFNVAAAISKYSEKNNRLVLSCRLSIILMYHNGNFIPLGKIFKLDSINKDLKKIADNKKKYFRLIAYFIKFFIVHIGLNFFLNKNFRLFLKKAISRLKFVFSNKKLCFPLKIIGIYALRNTDNLDLEFTKSCNCYSTFDGEKIGVACISRLTMNNEIKPSTE